MDDIDITFLGDRVISIIISNKKYNLISGVMVGDDITKVYKTYKISDYKGKFDDGAQFEEYYCKIKTDSPWKEPQYTMRFIYQDNIIEKIVLFYTE